MRRPQPHPAQPIRHQDRAQRAEQHQVHLRPGDLDPLPDQAGPGAAIAYVDFSQPGDWHCRRPERG